MIVLYDPNRPRPIVRVGDLLWDMREDLWRPAPPLAPDIPVRTGIFHPLPPAAGEGEGILVNPAGGEALRLRADGEVAWWRQVAWGGPEDLHRWAGPLGPGGWMTPEGDLLLPGLWLGPDGEVRRVRIADWPVQGVGPGRSVVLGMRRIRPLPGGGWRVTRLRHVPYDRDALALHIGPAGEVWAWPDREAGLWRIEGGPARGRTAWETLRGFRAIRALADGRWAAVSYGDRGAFHVCWGTPADILGSVTVRPEGPSREVGPLRPLPGGGWLLPLGDGILVGDGRRAWWRPFPIGWPRGTIPLPDGLIVRGEAAWWAVPAAGLRGKEIAGRMRPGMVEEVRTAGNRAMIRWRDPHRPAWGWGGEMVQTTRYTRWPSGEDLLPPVHAADVGSEGFWALWRGGQGEFLAGRVGDRGQPAEGFRMPPGHWTVIRALPDGTAVAAGREEGGREMVLRLGPEGPRGGPQALPREISPESVERSTVQGGPAGVWIFPAGAVVAMLAAPDGSLHPVWEVEG